MFEGYVFVEKNGAPAKDRFTDAKAVRAVYQKLSEDDFKESQRRLRIRRLYDGNLPYNPDDLKACGLKDLTNVNFLGLKGTIDNRADAILKLQSDTANLVELRPIARELAGPDASRISDVVAEEFSSMLREGGRFVPALAMMNKEADLYGLGPITWPNDLDYAPVALERAQIRFHENASVVSSSNDLYMFESVLSAEYLQSLRDNREIAGPMGWRIPAVERWMAAVYRDGRETRSDAATPDGTTPAESAQSMYRRNVWGEDRQFDELHVIHVYVREVAWPRGITHIVIPALGEPEDFLYYRKNAYRTMDECFLWFPYSVKERYAREVRGLGSLLYAPERLKNRFYCRLFDTAFRSGSLVLNSQAPGTMRELTLNELGPYTVLPPGITPAPAQMSPNFQQLVTVGQILDQVAVSTTLGQDKQPLATTAVKLFKGSADRNTKEEIELQQRIRSHKTEAEFSERKDVIDKVCRQAFRRTLALALLPDFARVDYPEVQDFIERCAMRGVTLEHLAAVPQLFSVVSCRDLALGADGKVAELDALHQQYAGDMDEAGRRRLVRRRVTLRFGQKDADDLVPEISRDQAPSDQASFAVQENNALKQGFQAMVGADQMHWSHIPVHAQLLQEIVELVAAPEDNAPKLDEWNGDPQQSQQIGEQTLQNLQEQDPRKMLGILVATSQHVQEHLAIGGQQIGMEGARKQTEKVLRDLRSTIKALNLAVATQQRVEQAQREAAEREQEELRRRADENELRKAQYEADKKAEVQRYAVDRQHEVAMHKAELEAGRASAAEGRENARFAGEEARRDAESASRIEREQRLARAKVNAANAMERMSAMQSATGQGLAQPGELAPVGPDNYEAL